MITAAGTAHIVMQALAKALSPTQPLQSSGGIAPTEPISIRAAMTDCATGPTIRASASA